MGSLRRRQLFEFARPRRIRHPHHADAGAAALGSASKGLCIAVLVAARSCCFASSLRVVRHLSSRVVLCCVRWRLCRDGCRVLQAAILCRSKCLTRLVRPVSPRESAARFFGTALLLISRVLPCCCSPVHDAARRVADPGHGLARARLGHQTEAAGRWVQPVSCPLVLDRCSARSCCSPAGAAFLLVLNHGRLVGMFIPPLCVGTDLLL